MKKLLIAMMSVASLAFISKAEEATAINSGTTFEGYEGAFNADLDDTGGNDGTFWHTAGSASDCAMLTNTDYTVVSPFNEAKNRPAIHETAPDTDTEPTALAIEAEQRLERGIVNYSNGFAPQDIGTGIYFDTMVQFTATDTAPTPESGDKLVVWLYGSAEEDGAFGIGTNLIVTAGYLKGPDHAVTVSNYVASAEGVNVEPGTWHRLTIKSISDIGSEDNVVGFVVFVDGKALSCSSVKGDEESIFASGINTSAAKWNNAGQLFPTLDTSSGTKQKLSSVSLEGTGMIDDISFTSVAPEFAVDAAQFVLNWDDHVTGMNIKIGDAAAFDLTAEELAKKVYAITVPTDGMTVVVTPGYEGSDYGLDRWTISENGVTREGNKFDVTGASEATLISKETAVRATVTIGAEATTYATLAAALADTRLTDQEATETKAYITLSADAVGEDLMMEPMVYAEIILDLNGYKITGNSEGSASAVINSATILTIKDSSAAKTGEIVAAGSQKAIINTYALTIESGKITGDIDNSEMTSEGDEGCFISGGSYSGAEGTFYLSSYVTEGLTATYSAGYWTVAEGGEQPPEPTAYKLTIPEVTGATAAVTAGGVTVADPTKIAENTEVVVTWTLTEGYKLTAGSLTETITMTADTTAATPTVKAITYATVTITSVDNCKIVVKNGDDVVTTGTKFDVDEEVELTVTRAAAEGYELDNCAAEETVTMTEDKTITAAVKSTTPAEKDYPAYIAEGDKGKYDTWAEYYKIEDRKDTAAALQNAYLLNVDPDDATTEAAKFACVSITVNGTSVTVTASATNSEGNAYNGTVEIKGSATLTGTYDLPADSTAARFFKAFLK